MKRVCYYKVENVLFPKLSTATVASLASSSASPLPMEAERCSASNSAPLSRHAHRFRAPTPAPGRKFDDAGLIKIIVHEQRLRPPIPAKEHTEHLVRVYPLQLLLC